jgi:hypothetical protein
MEESARSGSVGGVVGHLALPAAGLVLSGLAAEHPAVAREAINEHLTTGGSTFNPRTGANLSGARKWSVGISPESTSISDHPPTPEEYSGFTNIHADVLKHPATAIGTSIDPKTGLHQMEVVGLTSSKPAATALGNHLGESSIYHIGRDETAPLAGGDRSPSPLSLNERLSQLTDASPRPETYSGTHYSDAKIDAIEGTRRGLPSGPDAQPTGSESARLRLGSSTGLGPDAPPGFYTYRNGTLPEPSIGVRKNAYPVRGQFAFGSTESPEFQAAYHNVSANALSSGADPATAHGLGLNAGEHALRDAGYDGYSSPQHPSTNFIFDRHELTPREPSPGMKAFDDSRYSTKHLEMAPNIQSLWQESAGFGAAPEDIGTRARTATEAKMGPLKRGSSVVPDTFYHGSDALGANAVDASGRIQPEPLTQAHLTPDRSTAASYAKANNGKVYSVKSSDIPPDVLAHYSETGRGPIVLSDQHSVPVTPDTTTERVPFAEWPENYRQAGQQPLSSTGGPGANYSAEDLAALKQRMGIK